MEFMAAMRANFAAKAVLHIARGQPCIIPMRAQRCQQLVAGAAVYGNTLPTARTAGAVLLLPPLQRPALREREQLQPPAEETKQLVCVTEQPVKHKDIIVLLEAV